MISAKTIITINLSELNYEVKIFPSLSKYIGGVGLGAFLYKEYHDADPVIFSVGPLNGFFPFASKTSIVLNHEGSVEDIYIGGSLSTRIRYAGLDAVLITGIAKESVVLEIIDEAVRFLPADTDDGSVGLPGKRCLLRGQKLDDYFSSPGEYLSKKMLDKGVLSLSVTGTKTFTVPRQKEYDILYHKILAKVTDVDTNPDGVRSCSGCPVGCSRAVKGEIGGNVLTHCLVACSFAQRIYSDIGVVYSCLSALDYRCTHEDLENLPSAVEDLLNSI